MRVTINKGADNKGEVRLMRYSASIVAYGVVLSLCSSLTLSAQLSLDSGFDNEAGELIANNEADDDWVVTGPDGSDIGPVAATVVKWSTTRRSRYRPGSAARPSPSGSVSREPARTVLPDSTGFASPS